MDKTQLKGIMAGAWKLARYGASIFGGKSREYHAEALHIIWSEQKNPPLYIQGSGVQYWMGFVPRREQLKRGQFSLPGMALK